MGLFRYHMWPFSAIRWQVQPATRRLHQKWSYRVVSHPDNLYASQKRTDREIVDQVVQTPEKGMNALSIHEEDLGPFLNRRISWVPFGFDP